MKRDVILLNRTNLRAYKIQLLWLANTSDASDRYTRNNQATMLLL